MHIKNRIDLVSSQILHNIYIARNISMDDKRIRYLLSVSDTFHRALGNEMENDEIEKLCQKIESLI
jgi:hypothetical protein